MRLPVQLFLAGIVLLQSCSNDKSETRKRTADTINIADSLPITINDQMPDSPPAYPPPPPKPPPPPLPKADIITAQQLAADYAAGEPAAAKKYKKYNNILIVEGIIKKIKEPAEYKMIIILDGTPASIDVQCETAWPIKNLSPGMKATFIGHYAKLDGNVILTRCHYFEDPTYE